MYAIGDKVVHPAHGAGVIAAVEVKDVHESYSRYYIIELAGRDMRLMVPVRTAEEIGLRPVAPRTVSEEVFVVLSGAPDSLPEEFKERQAALGKRIREGDTVALAGVVRDMAARGREKPYSPTEARLFEQARSMLCGEVALSLDTDVEVVLRRVEAAVIPGGDPV